MSKRGRFVLMNLVLGLTAALAAGCSTQVKVAQLNAEQLQDNGVVDGLPFRIKQRYRVKLYRLVDDKYVKVDQEMHYANLADLDNVYVLKLDGGMLADGQFNFKINPDNTLQQVKITSTSKAPEAIASLGKIRKDVTDAGKARDAAALASLAADEAGTVKQEDAELAALEAQQAAELAQEELAALAPAATAVAKKTAELKVAKARLLANQKARRAGLVAPFPTI